MAPAFRSYQEGDDWCVLARSPTPGVRNVGEELIYWLPGRGHQMAPTSSGPQSYNWLPPSDLPSGVLELADLFEVHARDLASGLANRPS